jgi:hypothetical protein
MGRRKSKTARFSFQIPRTKNVAAGHVGHLTICHQRALDRKEKGEPSPHRLKVQKIEDTSPRSLKGKEVNKMLKSLASGTATFTFSTTSSADPRDAVVNRLQEQVKFKTFKLSRVPSGHAQGCLTQEPPTL